MHHVRVPPENHNRKERRENGQRLAGHVGKNPVNTKIRFCSEKTISLWPPIPSAIRANFLLNGYNH